MEMEMERGQGMSLNRGEESKCCFKLFGAVINVCKSQEEEEAGEVGSKMINCSSNSGGIASLERHSSFDSMMSEISEGDEVVVVKTDEDENRKSAECKRQREIWKRKRGESWSEQEHRAFLVGLEKLGAGKWKRISEEFVPTRTPTQVASHAQKYFIRKAAASGNTKRRASIFDTQLPKHAVDKVSSSSNAAVAAAVVSSPSALVPNRAPRPQVAPYVHVPYSMGFRGYNDNRLQSAAGRVAFVPVWQMPNLGHLNPGNSNGKLFNFMPMS